MIIKQENFPIKFVKFLHFLNKPKFLNSNVLTNVLFIIKEIMTFAGTFSQNLGLLETKYNMYVTSRSPKL